MDSGSRSGMTNLNYVNKLIKNYEYRKKRIHNALRKRLKKREIKNPPE